MPPVRPAALAALCLTAALAGLAAVRAEPAPPPRDAAKYRVVPDWAFTAIVREASGFVQEPFGRPRLAPNAPCEVSPNSTRANALLIALAAQNRMPTAGADVAKLATLRDAAVKFAAAVEKTPFDTPELRKLAGVLSRYPDIEADPAASRTLVRLNGPFNHDDVASLFGGCSGNKTQRIELNLVKLMRQKTPYTAEQAEKVELLAYKAALLGELIADMDDFLPTIRRATTAAEREEWVAFADAVHGNGWDLAATARRGDDAGVRRALAKLTTSCNDCHIKFRE